MVQPLFEKYKICQVNLIDLQYNLTIFSVSRLSLTTSLRTQTYFQPKKPDALADYPQQAYSKFSAPSSHPTQWKLFSTIPTIPGVYFPCLCHSYIFYIIIYSLFETWICMEVFMFLFWWFVCEQVWKHWVLKSLTEILLVVMWTE